VDSQAISLNKKTKMILIIVPIAIIVSIMYSIHNSPLAVATPSITKDPNLKVQTLVNGLDSPTSMAFIDNYNILVLEKGGQVRLVSNGILRDKPVLQVTVDTQSERGLLGISIMNRTDNAATTATALNSTRKFVFLYYTESNDGELRNRVYKYSWNAQDQTLVNPILILDLPALPGPNHDGGKLVIGPDHYLYAVIGDLNHRGKIQNIIYGSDPDDTSVIFRVKPDDGSAVPDNPFINDQNVEMHKYYAYGIRNSFGIAFDPVTANLWQTENGPDVFDEINVVKPGFNSGWIKVMGPLSRNAGVNIADELTNYPGSHYADPVFSWKNPIAVTDIEFLKSSALGQKYQNNIFVGDYNNGNLYYFEVNSTRTGIKPAPGLILDNDDQLSAVTFGTGFGAISDMKTGPKDGYL
jgi:glucose/arabinose dehydrogenase